MCVPGEGTCGRSGEMCVQQGAMSVWARCSQQHKPAVVKKPPMYEHLPGGLWGQRGRDRTQAVMKAAGPVRIIHVRLWEGQER